MGISLQYTFLGTVAMDLNILMKQPSFIIAWNLSATKERMHDFFARLQAHPDFGLGTYLAAVPYVYLEELKAQIAHPQIIWGGSEMHNANADAFTASIAGRLLRKKGAHFVLIGTYEHRQKRHESQESINRKVHTALAAGVIPLLCLSESEAQALEQQSTQVIGEQFDKATAGLTSEQLKNIVIVFEAPWLETTLLELSAEMILGRYELYRQIIRARIGTEVADEMHYAFGFLDQIKSLAALYDGLPACSFYTNQPESLLSLLAVAAKQTSHQPSTLRPEKQAPEISLPLDAEFENELIASNIIKEAGFAYEVGLPPLASDEISRQPSTMPDSPQTLHTEEDPRDKPENSLPPHI